MDSQDVNSSIAKRLHTLVMVVIRVDAVDSYGIDSEGLEDGEVSCTIGTRGQGVEVG